jgi:cobalt-zinc-cadmium efflux system membrane fusion protein
MSIAHPEVELLKALPPAAGAPLQLKALPPARPNRLGRATRLAGRLLVVALALGCAAGVAYLGYRTHWAMPKFSALLGETEPPKDDWCTEHGVPESACVECDKSRLPSAKGSGWCRVHGVPDCPLEHPEVAQTPSPPAVTDADRERAARTLAFAPRPENSSKCKLHQRRIQLASQEVVDRLGITVAPVTRAPITESVSAPGEIGYDPTRVAHLSARVPGTVWRVEKQIGDAVKAGEVLALVDAAEVGKAKAEFQQALVDLGLRRQTLANLRASAGAVPGRAVVEAESASEEAGVRLLTAEQALANLGMPVRAEDVRDLSPADLARRVQFLGLPDSLAARLARETASSNLIAVTAPFDGEVVARSAVAGEAADPARSLFVVADTRRMWLTLRVRVEDARRLRAGQPVRFQHAGHDDAGADAGTVAWVSPAADETTRTVAVRVDLPNAGGRHRANTFGTGRVILREEPSAIVVPSGAVHWEGDCNIVFVKDKNFDKPGGPRVFHVRTIRPGAKDVAAGGPVTEVIAGVLPGEWVAVQNSGFLRSELLKNSLGEG